MMRQLKGWNPNLSMKFACVSCTHHEHNRKVTLYGIFNEPVLLMPACHMRLDVELSTCGITQDLKKFQSWVIWEFGPRDGQPMSVT